MSIARFAGCGLDRPGTPRAAWEPWLRRLPEFDSAPWTDRPFVIVAPHPDDEVLGVGGIATMLAAAGGEVRIVAVTDGESSHPGSPTVTRAALAARRRHESRSAADALGIHDIVRCGLPDGAVSAHTDRLADLLSRHLPPGAVVAVPFAADGHPDHEATARAARAAAAHAATVIEYPIWMWHWSFPGDPEIDWGRAHRVELTAAAVARKHAAVACFESQIRPLSPDPADRAVLPPWILDRLLRENEVILW
ncbi:PIG-L deacetylase family protein [Nocardia aurantia]|uniref:PIG-L family deacetylase n=1 Tax=Nocardia aurantia TaxID=2585199 RepID=A0A7K0DH49_9NOCA|nr:PIG-L family deacetylase [Nocardia aurantia]MQY25125.1 hypothetical protein [Nocardia aurantia]